MKNLCYLLIIFVFTSCKTLTKKTAESAWGDEDKTSFSTECEKGASGSMGADAAATYCDCMLTKIMDKYPDAETVGSISMDEMTKMAEGCI